MFTIIIEHGEEGEQGMVVTVGKLRLVDLAGSERSLLTFCVVGKHCTSISAQD